MAVCPNCGAANNEGSKFCSSCGGPLPVSAPAPAAAPAPAPQPVQPVQPQAVPVQPQVQPVAQPVYAQPITQPVAQQPKTNGLCKAGFILGIIGFFTAGITSVFGLILSVIGLISASKKQQPGKGKAVAGIIMSSIVIVSVIAFWGVFMNVVEEELGSSGFSSTRSGSTIDADDITDVKWIERDGSYLVFGKGKSFKYYQSYADTSDYYYTGTYKLYFGQEAIDKITKEYKEYGVTED